MEARRVEVATAASGMRKKYLPRQQQDINAGKAISLLETKMLAKYSKVAEAFRSIDSDRQEHKLDEIEAGLARNFNLNTDDPDIFVLFSSLLIVTAQTRWNSMNSSAPLKC